MSLILLVEFLMLLGALLVGALIGYIALGLWGAVGLLVPMVGFGVPPGAIPSEGVVLMLTLILARSASEVAGGVGLLVRVAKRILRKTAKQVIRATPQSGTHVCQSRKRLSIGLEGLYGFQEASGGFNSGDLYRVHLGLVCSLFD